MNKITLALLTTLSLNTVALAVDLNTGKTEDPKQADAALVSQDQLKKKSLEEKRTELKIKHKKKKDAQIAAKAAIETSAAAFAKAASNDASKVNSNPLKDLNRESKLQEFREETAPKK